MNGPNHPGQPSDSWPQQPGGPWPQQPGGPWPQQPGGPWPQQPQQPGGPWPQQPQLHPGTPGHAWHGQPVPGSPVPPWPTPHAPYPHPWPAGIVVPRQQHEFTAEENETLADLARWSGALGILKLVQAATGILGKNVLGCLIELAVGLSLLGGRKALRNAVDTAGNDVDHLMIAVEKLTTVFQFRLILSLMGAILVFVGVIAVLVMSAFGEPLDLGFLD